MTERLTIMDDMSIMHPMAKPPPEKPEEQTYIIDFYASDWHHAKALAALRGVSIRELVKRTIYRTLEEAAIPRTKRKAHAAKTTATAKVEVVAPEERTMPAIVHFPAADWPRVKSLAALQCVSLRQLIQRSVFRELEDAGRSGELVVKRRRHSED